MLSGIILFEEIRPETKLAAFFDLSKTVFELQRSQQNLNKPI